MLEMQEQLPVFLPASLHLKKVEPLVWMDPKPCEKDQCTNCLIAWRI